MGNSLIFIEVFIVYQTAKQTGMISIFLLLLLLFSFLKRRKEDSIKRNKKKKETRIETSFSLSPSPLSFEGIFQFYRNSSGRERADGCVESPCTNRRK